ncbi:MAG: 30S ribosomal protein S11 [Solitalea-like symbiont of Acarus siro]
MSKAPNKKASKKVKVKFGSAGQAHIVTTFNNMKINITNEKGETILWSSAGKKGYKGSKKNTPFAAMQIATDCSKQACDLGLKDIDVFIKGPGAGREAAIRALYGGGLNIKTITDVTPLPHNGCRPPKRRRV